MKAREYECPTCSTVFVPVRHGVARWIAAGTGVVVGGAMVRSLFWGVVAGGLTYWAAAAIDDRLGRRCPKCGAIGEAIEAPVTPLRAEENAAVAA
jgi:hypothetical protein